MVSLSEYEMFMDEALKQARQALLAGEFPVGCVMGYNGQIVASGARKSSKGCNVNEIDHAEVVTLRKLLAREREIDISRVIVYSTMEPCLMCFATMILSGIRTIVYGYEDVMGGGCGLDLGTLPSLYSEMKIDIIKGVRRERSLELFKEFFGRADSDYWQDSLLARYTLSQ